MLRDGRVAGPRRALPERYDRGAPDPRDSAERPPADRGELSLRADRHHEPDEGERGAVPAADRPHDHAPDGRRARRRDRPVWERVALVLHTGETRARAVLRRLFGTPAR